MNEILGLSYTSVWWAFGYLVAVCAIMTPIDRLMAKAAAGVSGSSGARIVRFVLDCVCGAAVLFVLDRVMSGVTLTWWALAALALAMGALMAFANSGD